MTIQGVPEGGFKTVGEIVATNSLQFSPNQEALSVAVELVSTHTSGGPNVVRSITRHDLLRAWVGLGLSGED
ncbi:MAG: hypothetical protein AB7T38_05730 [Nitrospirales bacterium]